VGPPHQFTLHQLLTESGERYSWKVGWEVGRIEAQLLWIALEEEANLDKVVIKLLEYQLPERGSCKCSKASSTAFWSPFWAQLMHCVLESSYHAG